jgi:hypothetical protein
MNEYHIIRSHDRVYCGWVVAPLLEQWILAPDVPGSNLGAQYHDLIMIWCTVCIMVMQLSSLVYQYPPVLPGLLQYSVLWMLRFSSCPKLTVMQVKATINPMLGMYKRKLIIIMKTLYYFYITVYYAPRSDTYTIEWSFMQLPLPTWG